MNKMIKILTFVFMVFSILIARGADTNNKSTINMKINPYYFDIGEDDGDLLYKKRSHKRRKIKRKPRRGRDNR
tara:strand:- start:34 stop:252 length:219 start_codon:yes stop_codon:yes gene_type:complete